MNYQELPYSPGSILFAPMEGITEPVYRQTVMKLYPGWSHFCTDFLRIPTTGHFSEKKIIHHFGESIFANEKFKAKTTFQVLTSARANNEFTVKQIEGLGFKHLDLNLGCPSKKVNSHGGGAYLLSSPEELKKVISTIRENYQSTFTVKMRVGYRDDKSFEESLKIIEGEGAQGVTLHARTRDQLYKGVAKWSYIEQAQKLLSIPLIGNGDVWSPQDVKSMFEQTGCHSIMMGRGALKTPWLPRLLEKQEVEPLTSRKKHILEYFDHLEVAYAKIGWEEHQILRRFKALARYLFDDFAPMSKSLFLRSKNLSDAKTIIKKLPTTVVQNDEPIQSTHSPAEMTL